MGRIMLLCVSLQGQSNETEQDDNYTNLASDRSNPAEQPHSPQRICQQERSELQENERNAQTSRRGIEILHDSTEGPSLARRNIENGSTEETNDTLHIPTDPLLISQHVLIPYFDYSDAPPNYESLDMNVNNFILNEIPQANYVTHDPIGDSLGGLADLQEDEPPPPSYEFVVNNTEESNVANSVIREDDFNTYDFGRRNERQDNMAENERVFNDNPVEPPPVYQTSYSDRSEPNPGSLAPVFAQGEIQDLNFENPHIPDKKRNAPLRFFPLRSPFNTKMLIVMNYSFLIKFY